MGKLKEKLLNGLTEEQMEERFGLSAFEYVELVEKYKKEMEEEYIPTDEEYEEMMKMAEEYYNSEEFRNSFDPNSNPNDIWTKDID